jgi:hypothetical protein
LGVSLQVELPPGISRELLRRDLCTLPLSQRGAATDVAVAIVVTGIAGNLSSVVVAAPSVRDFAAGLIRAAWHQRTDPTHAAVRITLTRADGSELRVEVSGMEDEQAAELVQRALESAIGD